MKATIEMNNDGFSAHLTCGEILVSSMGDNIRELMLNFIEAVELVIDGETSEDAKILGNWSPTFTCTNEVKESLYSKIPDNSEDKNLTVYID